MHAIATTSTAAPATAGIIQLGTSSCPTEPCRSTVMTPGSFDGAVTLTCTVAESLCHWLDGALTVMVALPAEWPVTTSVSPLTYAVATSLLEDCTETSGFSDPYAA